MNNGFFTPAELTKNYAAAGAAKTKRGTAHLIVLGILAGAFIAFGSAATNTAVYGIADTWTARTIAAVLFPFGLCMVIAFGAELFTGNCLISISLLDKQCTAAGLIRNWVIVYLSNMLGSVLVAAGCAFFGQMNYSNGELALYTMRVAANKCAMPFQNAFVLGILCNVLVCFAVLMANSAKDNTGRFLGAYMPVCFFVLCGFEHSVANMYYIPAGLMAAAVPQYQALAQSAGLDLSHLNLQGFLLGNLLPVTLGNIVGGVAVGWSMWFTNLRDKK